MPSTRAGGLTLLGTAVHAVSLETLVAVGARMALVLGAFAILVLGTLRVYAIGQFELRTLATVVLLGPFTMVRPLVVTVAVAYGVAGSTDVIAYALAITAGAAVPVTGWLLDRTFPAWGPST